MEKEKGLEIKSMHIKYVFTEDEKKEIAEKLALKTSEKMSIEDQKKEVSSQLTAQINAAVTAISRFSNIYNQGYEFKNWDCYEVFDYDEKQVFTYRADTDDLVNTRTMLSSEYQREMFQPTEKISEGEPLLGNDDTAVEMAMRFKKEYPTQFEQACIELEFQNDPEKMADVVAIKLCEHIKSVLDSEDTGPDYEKLAEGDEKE